MSNPGWFIKINIEETGFHYFGIAAASFLSGLVKGCNNSYDLNPTTDPALEVSGMAVGTAIAARKVVPRLAMGGRRQPEPVN